MFVPELWVCWAGWFSYSVPEQQPEGIFINSQPLNLSVSDYLFVGIFINSQSLNQLVSDYLFVAGNYLKCHLACLLQVAAIVEMMLSGGSKPKANKNAPTSTTDLDCCVVKVIFLDT